MAPPWEEATGDPSALTDGGSSVATRSRKRSAEQISDAETTLGKLASETAVDIANRGCDTVLQSLRGQSNIAASVRHVPRKAARLREHLRQRGAAVPTVTSHGPSKGETRPCGGERTNPHKASGHLFARKCWTFVAKSIVWWCLTTSSATFPTCASSLSVLSPQRDRGPRLIVDYTFSDVNEETIPMAPCEAMQFGRALHRICSRLVHADPRFGPVKMAKIDIADGFYRVWLWIADAAKLGVAYLPVQVFYPWWHFHLPCPWGGWNPHRTLSDSPKPRATWRTSNCLPLTSHCGGRIVWRQWQPPLGPILRSLSLWPQLSVLPLQETIAQHPSCCR